MITSDLHLGHSNIHKYRKQFSSAEEHHEIVFDKLATSITKRDSLILLGDIAFSEEWLHKLATLRCKKKTLILGNHDTEKISMGTIMDSGAYDSIHSLWSKRNCWFSHCPIHPDELRGRVLNIHGHLHDKQVEEMITNQGDTWIEKDLRYFNACVEHTNYEPIAFSEIMERL